MYMKYTYYFFNIQTEDVCVTIPIQMI